MHIRRTIASALLAFAFVCTAAIPAGAARIYNDLPFPIVVSGRSLKDHHDGPPPPGMTLPPGEWVRIAPGQRSESISWMGVYNFNVTADGPGSTGNICSFNFGMSSELTGGHYLIIGHQGIRALCLLCDSDAKIIRMLRPDKVWDALDRERSTKDYC